ncbi:MAG: hypothetical protein AB4426_07700 [Xenococcaceae cyanobacterium]
MPGDRGRSNTVPNRIGKYCRDNLEPILTDYTQWLKTKPLWETYLWNFVQEVLAQKLREALPEQLQGSWPTIEQLEAELETGSSN